jgi:hypothetical protein
VRYYGLSEVDAQNPDVETVTFISLVLLFGGLAMFFLLIGVGFNFLFGIALFMVFSLAMVFLLYMRGVEERNLDKALADIPTVKYVPAMAYSVDKVLRELDERVKKEA